MAITVDLDPHKIATGDTDYPTKHNAALDAIELALETEIQQVNTAQTAAEAARDAAKISETNAKTSEVAANADAANLSAINLNISETPSLNADPGTIPVRKSSGLIGNDSIDWNIPGVTRVLAMTDGVVAGIYPATENGVPDTWRFNKAASWYDETRTAGIYLGEHANVTTAAVVSGAAIADYYYDTTSKTYQELTNVSTPASTETFRAGSAEFPAEIIIVTIDPGTSALVYILDAKDGSMWMVFTAINGNMVGWHEPDYIDFSNGLLVVGDNSFDVYAVYFKDGLGRSWRENSSSEYEGTIAERNDTKTFQIISTDNVILSRNIRAVAIGDASKDYGFDEWGVPKQFIAVGCSSTNGISVIHPNGKVYDISGFNDAIVALNFNGYGEIVANGLNDGRAYIFGNIPRDISQADFKRRMFNMSNPSGTVNTFPRIGPAGAETDTIIDLQTLDSKLLATKAETGFTVIDEDVYGADGTNAEGSDSPASYIGYDSVLTEHFHSPLVDRLVTAALGMEIGTGNLVEAATPVNGTFDSNINNWTNPTSSRGTISFDSGTLKIVNIGAGGGFGRANQSITTVVGKAYMYRCEITAGTANDYSFTASNNSDSSAAFEVVTRTSTGALVITFIATATTTYLGLGINTDTDAVTANFDDVTGGLATQDRSQLNTNHAKINGTITRAAYDSGDVIMHSGANIQSPGQNIGAYWELGYDVFATDGVLYDGWLDAKDVSSQPLISNRPLDGSGNPIVWSSTGGDKGSVLFANLGTVTIRNDNNSTVTNTVISSALPDGLHHILIILSSTDFYVYIDGELDKITASVTLTVPTDAITYVHPKDMALPRVGGIDRKGIIDWEAADTFYRWKYKKERRLFNNGAKCILQGTGNVIDIAVDEVNKTYTILQTDHYTTFDVDGIVAADAAVSNTGVSVSTHDGDLTILDGANLTITSRARSVSNDLFKADRVATKRTFEFDSLVEADARVFGDTIANAPNTGGDTIGGALLDWDGAESTDPTLSNVMLTQFGDQAGDYLVALTVANRSAGTVQLDISGTAGTARSTNATFTETLTYDPAASSSDDIVFNDNATAFDGQVSAYRIRPVGIPFWLEAGWRIEAVREDGLSVRPDTPDLVRDGAITRRYDGKQGWLSTTGTWNTLSIDAVEDV